MKSPLKAIGEDFDQEVADEAHRKGVDVTHVTVIEPTLIAKFEKLMKECDEIYKDEIERRERMREKDDLEVEAPGVGGGVGEKVKMLHYTKHNLDELIKEVDKFDQAQVRLTTIIYY